MIKRMLNAGICLIAAMLCHSSVQAAGWDPDTWASNTDSIVNTRHNLTMSYMTHEITGADFSWLMDTSRINYGEVCVYCHTPHGSNTSTLQAPLWNRAMGTTVYDLYSIPLSSGQSATAPGSNSLACLSCHDGTLAIDAVINLPGSGYYAGEDTIPSNAFLDAWPTGTVSTHKRLKSEVGLPPDSCRLCHKAGSVAENLPFDAFTLGTDLRDDHPIGVEYPSYIDADYDYNPPDIEVANRYAYFQSSANGRADKNEIRLYDSGEGYEVECATCHDPHGVPSAGPGSEFIPSFLRVNNAGSALCMTCHTK